LNNYQDLELSEPIRTLSEMEAEEMKLNFYNTDTHKAAFVLPQFAKKVSLTFPPI